MLGTETTQLVAYKLFFPTFFLKISMNARWYPASAPTASAETPLAALSAGVTVALLLILKKGTAQVSVGLKGQERVHSLKPFLFHIATSVKAILILICCHLLFFRYWWVPHISWPLWPRPVCEHPRRLWVQVWWRLWKWIHDDEELHG